MAPHSPPPVGGAGGGVGARRARGSLVGPLILIIIGGILFLQNLGILPWSAWGELWRFWPILLVLAGLEVLLGNRAGGALAGVAIAAIVLLAIVGLGLAGASSRLNGEGTVAGVASDQALHGAQQARVTVRFGAGSVHIGALPDGETTRLSHLVYSGPSSLQPVAAYTVTNGVGRLGYSARGGSGGLAWFPFVGASAPAQVQMQLARSIPTSLTMQFGATESVIDLTQLSISDLDLSSGAASTDLRLPLRVSGTLAAHVTGGAANVEIRIPPGIAARIHHRGGLSSFDIDQTRFPLVDDETYRSSDYATSQSRVDLSVESGVSSIRVS